MSRCTTFHARAHKIINVVLLKIHASLPNVVLVLVYYIIITINVILSLYIWLHWWFMIELRIKILMQVSGLSHGSSDTALYC